MIYNLDELIPQKPPMRLIDKCINFDQKVVHCQVEIKNNNIFFCDVRRAVPHWVAIEMMAQTSAVCAKLSSLQEKKNRCKESQMAFLMSVRQYKTEVIEYHENQVLDIFSEAVYIEDGMGLFKANMSINGKLIATVNISAYQPQSKAELSKVLTREGK